MSRNDRKVRYIFVFHQTTIGHFINKKMKPPNVQKAKLLICFNHIRDISKRYTYSYSYSYS